MKKTLLASALLLSVGAAHAVPIISMELTGALPVPTTPADISTSGPYVSGSYFSMGGGDQYGVQPGEFANMTLGGYDGGARLDADTRVNSIGHFQFGAFGPVLASTMNDPLEDGSNYRPLTGDVTNGVLTLDLDSWTAWYNGSFFNQGTNTECVDVFGTVTCSSGPATIAYDSSTGVFSARWDSVIVGGDFNGNLGNWYIEGIINEDLPVFTSAITANAAENSTLAYTATATDAQALTFSLAAGVQENDSFTIDGNSGALSFVSAPDFENPIDVGADNTYIVDITVTDLIGASVTQTVTITVTDVNESTPVFSSGTSVSMFENQASTGYIAQAADSAEPTQTISYSITGGADGALFNVDGASGALSFIAAPDFETPQDAGGLNIYNVEISASDDGSPINSVTQQVVVTVNNVEFESLSITSLATASFVENATGTVYTLTASGPNTPITFNPLGGADAAAFSFATDTGVLTFNSPPDFDTKASYTVEFTATDSAGTTAPYSVTISITDVNDLAPGFDSGTGVSMVENTVNTGYTGVATDPDAGDAITFSIASGNADDAALFSIGAATGVLTFIAAPDFEAPGDTNTDNAYVLTIEAFDGVNTGSQTVTVTVGDAPPAPPVITVPSCPSTNEGAEYFAPSATASDSLDGDISSDIVVNSSVDTSVPGDYVITYNVTNSEGDAAEEASCTVTVTNAPRLFVNGASVMNIPEGSEFSDSGAVATDVEDGVITGSIQSTGVVDPTTAGSYVITYSVTDSDSLTVIATRRVNVIGAAGSVLGINSLTIESGEFRMGDPVNGVGDASVISPGAIAPFVMGEYQGTVPSEPSPIPVYHEISIATFTFLDFGPVGVYVADTDGLNSNLILPSGSVDTVNSTISLTIPSWIAYYNGTSFQQGSNFSTNESIGGTFNASTGVFNISWVAPIVGGTFGGNTGFWEINGTASLNEPDSVLPVITLNGSTQLAIAQGAVYTEAGVQSAVDNIDGALDVSNVITAGGVDVNVPGTYTITYSIADSAGNTGVTTREVVVFTGAMPVITLIGDSVINLPLTTNYIEEGALAADDDEGDLTANIVIGGGVVDTSTVGTYTVTYNVTDGTGVPAFQVTRTVNVIDVDVPVITVSGANPVYIALGADYEDAGATATDNVDTNPGLTNRIVTDNPVDTLVEGTYTVTYTVFDTEGNEGTAARTVYVDGTGPVVTVTGNASIALNIGDEFTDEGATSLDSVSGESDVVADCAAVDTTVAGRYTCTYTSVDAAGNQSVVERVITVLDDTLQVTDPVLTLAATQDGEVTTLVVVDNGLVTVETNIVSVEGVEDTFDWTATDNNLLPQNAITDAATFVFDPSELADGIYEIVVTTNAGTEREVTSDKLLTVMSVAPELGNEDSDGDGVADSVEGIADSDNDGIANYLDDDALAENQIGAGDSNNVMVSSVGVLRLGSVSFSSGNSVTLISAEDIANYGGDAGGEAPSDTTDTAVENACSSGCYDFEVTGVEPGSSVDIVIPLAVALGSDPVYRKFTAANGWSDFDTSGDDAIASSGLVNGVCPAPDAANRWVDGLFEGDMCIRLTIQDGGVNDEDRTANGTIYDPSGAANRKAEAPASRDFGGSMSLMYLMMLTALFAVRRKKILPKS